MYEAAHRAPEDEGSTPSAASAGWSREVRSALRRLEPTQQRIIAMIYFDRRSQAEVAKELSLSRRVVARSAALGLQALAPLMLRRPD